MAGAGMRGAMEREGRAGGVGEASAARDGGDPDLAGDASPVSPLRSALLRLDQPFAVRRDGGELLDAADVANVAELGACAWVPALRPEWLGDAGFRAAHGVRFAYVAGEMANAIAGEALVEAMGRAGMLGFFGAAGCALERVEAAIDRIQAGLGDRPYGFNLIHSPGEPRLEEAVAELYLRRGVRLVSASAYLQLTPAIVRYRVRGLRERPDGTIATAQRVMAKVSRVEVARHFLAPAPPELLAVLRQRGDITEQESRLAAHVPLADDVTAEADSGGHTDNRPAITLVPTMIALRDRLAAAHRFSDPPRIGAAGGIATPASVAAAFAMGAAYVMSGSINQCCVEAGTSDAVRDLLARAEQADVAMAPAADMFEMGVNVQVLKRGTMFAQRARRLYELYRAYESLEALPAAQRTVLERDFFRSTLEEAWAETRAFFERRDPAQIERGERDPKHRMALVFRSYLGRASKWANAGEPSRKLDYQVWCGPAMGAFNEWARGSPLERPEQRDVVTLALNLMVGAAFATRVGWLRAQGVAVPPGVAAFRPLPREELAAWGG